MPRLLTNVPNVVADLTWTARRRIVTSLDNCIVNWVPEETQFLKELFGDSEVKF